ncbi:hypothetical protein THAR02_01722 [Trichoderma harzianum]|uniref:Uncharacterized protein n=1 Tax=Trichoderma harzianum TaxID=5544 RepID=A0A0G0ANY0_TRIHA|nr:hypothetical protein THAR02_01722 [Trichoderma harzianum]
MRVRTFSNQTVIIITITITIIIITITITITIIIIIIIIIIITTTLRIHTVSLADRLVAVPHSTYSTPYSRIFLLKRGTISSTTTNKPPTPRSGCTSTHA